MPHRMEFKEKKKRKEGAVQRVKGMCVRNYSSMVDKEGVSKWEISKLVSKGLEGPRKRKQYFPRCAKDSRFPKKVKGSRIQ